MADQSCEECECTLQDGKGVVKEDATYCSTYCANTAQTNGSDECQCGHAECA